MDRDAAVEMLKAMYRARAANDATAALEYFTEDAYFEMAESERAMPPAIARGRSEFATLLEALVATWEWKRHEIRSLIVDGDTAAVMYKVDVRHRPTGEETTTTCCDVMTLKGDKVVHMVEFVDTALVASLAEAPPRA